MQGAEFRVDAHVYVDGREAPIAHTTTYFREARVYDVHHDEPRHVVIFHRDPPSMTMLDYGRRVVCEVSGDEIMRTVAALAARASDKPPAVRFAAEPSFDAKWMGPGELQMVASPMQYTVMSQSPPLADAADVYRDFADWTSRLNATRAAGMPPFARMAVNRELAARERVPVRVAYEQREPELRLHSTHTYAWALHADDLRAIELIEHDRGEFSAVDLVAFRIDGEAPGRR